MREGGGSHHVYPLVFLVLGAAGIVACFYFHDWKAELFGVGVAFGILGVSAFTIEGYLRARVEEIVDRLVPLASRLARINKIFAGGVHYGFRQLYHSRRDPRLSAGTRRLIGNLDDTQTAHEVCISGVAGVSFFMDNGNNPIYEALLSRLNRHRAQKIDLKVCLLYPFASAARNRAIAEEYWARPVVQAEPELVPPPRPPRFANVAEYRTSRLYDDSVETLHSLLNIRRLIQHNHPGCVEMHVRYCTIAPYCSIFRVDGEMIVEHYQFGRVSYNDRYVSHHLPMVQYHDVPPSVVDGRVFQPPFKIYKNHFAYLWDSESTLSIDQVADGTGMGKPTILTPDQLRPRKASTHGVDPDECVQAARGNCFAVPSRRIYQRVGGNVLRGIRAEANGQPLMLVDVSGGGLRIKSERGIFPSDGTAARILTEQGAEDVVLEAVEASCSEGERGFRFKTPASGALIVELQRICGSRQS